MALWWVAALLLMIAVVLGESAASEECEDLVSGVPSGHSSFENCFFVDRAVILRQNVGVPITLFLRNVTWIGGSLVINSDDPRDIQIVAEECRFVNMTGMALCVVSTGVRGVRNITISVSDTFVSSIGGSFLSVQTSSSADSSNISLSLINSVLVSLFPATPNRGFCGVLFSSGNDEYLVIEGVTLTAVDSVINVTAQSRGALLGVIRYSTSHRSRVSIRRLSISVINTAIQAEMSNDGAFVGALATSTSQFGGAWLAVTGANLALHNSSIRVLATVRVAVLGLIAHSQHETPQLYASNVHVGLTSSSIHLEVQQQPGALVSFISVGPTSFSAHMYVSEFLFTSCDSWLSSNGYIGDALIHSGVIATDTYQDWQVHLLRTVITAFSAGAELSPRAEGRCFGSLPRATHYSSAPSAIRESMLACTPLSERPSNGKMLFVSGVRNATGDAVAFVNATLDPDLGPSLHAICAPSAVTPAPSGVGTPSRTQSRSITLARTTTTHTSTAMGSGSQSRSYSSSRSAPWVGTRGESPTASCTGTPLPMSPPAATRTSTSTRSLELANSAPPPPSRQPVSGSVQLQLLMPQVAADAVAAAGSTTAVVGGVISPASASQVARVGGMVRALECAIIQGDPKPSYVEMPLQIDFGGGKYATYAGSLMLTTVVVILVPFAFHAVWWRWQPERIVMLKAACAVHAASVQYFVPNALGAAVLLMANGDGTEAAIGAMCAAALLAVVAVVSRRIVVLKVDGEVKAAITPLFAFVDGARDLADVRVRVYALEELLVSSLIAVITSVRRGGCGSIALLIVVIAVAHLAYLVAVRPYVLRLEGVLVVGGCVLQLGLAGVVAVSVWRDDSGKGLLGRAIAGLLIAVFAQFFVQTLALLTMHCCKAAQRRFRRQATDAAVLVHPLLAGASVNDGSAGPPDLELAAVHAVSTQQLESTSNPLNVA